MWITDGRDTTLDVPSKTLSGYPVVERNDPPIRAYRDEVRAALGNHTLIDVRSRRSTPVSARTCRTTPRRVRCAAGTFRAANSVPWASAADDSGRFRSRAELEAVYDFVQDGDPVIAYCRIGERSSHAWFVLTHLLGVPNVRNYDGSWTEWGNTVRVPIATGEEPATSRERAPTAGRGDVGFRRRRGTGQVAATAGVRRGVAAASG